MAVLKGYAGSVKAGSTPTSTGEIKSFSLSINADVQETTSLGSAWATNVSTIKRWTAKVDAQFDIGDSGQDEFRSAFLAGSSVNLEFYLGGTTGAGNAKYVGSALIDSISIGNDVAGIVSASFSVTGSGALTETSLS